MHSKTDTQLVVAIQNGNVLAFETLVKRYQRGLFSFVFRFVREREAAEELVQDTFMRVYQAIDRVDTSRKFSTYLFEIAKNCAISYIRKKKYTIPLAFIEELHDDEKLYEQLIASDTSAVVRRAIRRLKRSYQAVLRLYYFEELSYEEISKKLKLPLNTVRTHVSRGKVELKKLLEYENT